MFRILVECVNVLLPVHELHAPVQPAEFDLLQVEVVAQDVQHLRHLDKDRYFNEDGGHESQIKIVVIFQELLLANLGEIKAPHHKGRRLRFG